MANHKRNHGIGPGRLGCLWRATLLLAGLWILLGTALAPQMVYASESAWPAMADTVFHHITPEQGLPHPVATAIAQTGDGFIWIGTENGLARWDGYRFRGYSTESGHDAASLPDNSITKMHTDRKGQLWLIFNNGNLARYDPVRDQFIVAPLLRGQQTIRLMSIADDDQGHLLVGTSAGLARVSNDGAKVEWPRLQGSDGRDLSALVMGSMVSDSKGRLWFSSDHGLWQQASPNGPLQAVALPAGVEAVGMLRRLRDGRILASSASHGVLLLDPDSGHIKNQQLDAAGRALFAQTRFATMVEVRPGEIWFGSFTQGILRLDLASGQTRNLQHDPAFATSLPVDTVNHLLLDRNGLIWVATQRGLSWHDPAQAAVLTLFSNPNQKNRIKGADVRSILPLGPDRILLGLTGQGVNLLNPAQQSVDAVVPLLARRMVQGLCRVPNGDVYYASDAGLVRTDGNGEQALEVAVAGGLSVQQTGVVEYFAKRLWVGRVDGLWQLDPDQSSPLLQRVAGTEALSGATIRALAWDGKHSLWIGTNSAGLYYYHIQQQKLEKVPLPRSANGGQFNFIATLLHDQKQRLWVGSQGDGIVLLPDASQNRVAGSKLLGKAQGLNNLMINRFLPDEFGKIWASTDGGLAQIDPQQLTASTLRRADGVQIETYWAGSGSKTASGDLLFGGAGGLTVVRPGLLQKTLSMPPLVLTNLQLGGKEVWVGPGGNADVALEIKPRANSMTVEFAALDYAAPERILYSYLLEGYDSDWINTSASRRLASYTNLPPGEYRLLLRASNRKGEWDESGQHNLVLTLNVLPHWWQTWWMRLLLVLASMLLLLALVQGRTRWLRLRQQQLEQQVAERTMQLHQNQEQLLSANQSLNQANTELAESMYHLKDAQAKLLQQEKLASIGTLTAGISHEINNPSNFAHVGAYNLRTDLAELHEFLWQLAGNDTPPELLQALDQRFEKLSQSLAAVTEGTTRIRDLVRDLRTFSRLDVTDWLVTPIGDSLRATINLVRTQYAADIRIELQLDANPDLLCWPAQLNQVFMNLIVNACQAMMGRPADVREREPGVLRISSRLDGEFLLLEFADNGPGIAPEIIERIFDPFFTTKTVGEGMGMGLSISHGIIEKHHGSITVQSTAGQGTCFSVRLPLAKPDPGDTIS